jgi:hypothetical protein
MSRGSVESYRNFKDFCDELSRFDYILDIANRMKIVKNNLQGDFPLSSLLDGISKTLSYIIHRKIENIRDGASGQLHFKFKKRYIVKAIAGNVLQDYSEGDEFDSEISGVSINTDDSSEDSYKEVIFLSFTGNVPHMTPFNILEISFISGNPD